MVKNSSDFVGDVLGASESNTRAILANTSGKVLVIDEVSAICRVVMLRELIIFNTGISKIKDQLILLI